MKITKAIDTEIDLDAWDVGKAILCAGNDDVREVMRKIVSHLDWQNHARFSWIDMWASTIASETAFLRLFEVIAARVKHFSTGDDK